MPLTPFVYGCRSRISVYQALSIASVMIAKNGPETRARNINPPKIAQNNVGTTSDRTIPSAVLRNGSQKNGRWSRLLFSMNGGNGLDGSLVGICIVIAMRWEPMP